MQSCERTSSALSIHSCQKKVRLADYLRQPHVEIRHPCRMDAVSPPSKPLWVRVSPRQEALGEDVAPSQMKGLRSRKNAAGRSDAPVPLRNNDLFTRLFACYSSAETRVHAMIGARGFGAAESGNGRPRSNSTLAASIAEGHARRLKRHCAGQHQSRAARRPGLRVNAYWLAPVPMPAFFCAFCRSVG
jgi:hypothetical protein